MPYVYSTLSNDNIYANYDNAGSNKDTPVLLRSVLIKGGAGIATKHLVTPLGIATKVTDDELEHLNSNEDFQRHVKNGYIKFDNKKVNADIAAKDMEKRDRSAPYDPENSDYGDALVAKPATGKIKK